MRTVLCQLFATATLIWGSSLGVAAEPSVTLETLLEEMADRTAVACFPSPAYTCRQASSYDRDATSPDEQETWYANWDRSQFVREEENDGRREYVLMDEAGPGAIVRFWATWHGPRGKEFTNGTLRIYLDNSPKPAIEGPIADVIDRGLLCGPPLSQGVSPETDYKRRGHNLYLPIPYAKHCKITYETTAPMDRGAHTGEALYYQINYRTYEKGTTVESFSMAGLAAAEEALTTTQQRLSASGRDAIDNLKETDFAAEIEPGKSHATAVQGPGAIRELVVQLAADDLEQALRSTVLELHFDGQQAVWAPVGDFFGIGHKMRPYKTWYTQVSDDGTMTCWWVMPFEESFEIAIHNLGNQTVEVTSGRANVSLWNWDDRSMHFFSTWRELRSVDTRSSKDMTGHGAFDVNYVTAKGQGVYVGDTLTIFNGAAKWWGEGDEKIYVDGEAFPSHFGTGTEDYYGYAWCRPERFDAPFHAQPEGGGNMQGGFAVNSRYRSLDAIPFTQSLQMDMELWHWAGTKVNYAPTTFWYARPGATSNVAPMPEVAAMPVARKQDDVVPMYRVKDALEGESLKIVSKTGGTTEIQNVPQFNWSGNEQLWWRDGKVGENLVLEFPVEDAGRYAVTARLTKAIDYAEVKLAINGASAGQFDRYHTAVENDVLKLGVFELKKGPNQLTVEIVGRHEKAIPRFMFGIDYLLLTPSGE